MRAVRLAITISGDSSRLVEGVAVVELDRSGLVSDIMFIGGIESMDVESLRELLSELDVDYILVKESLAGYLGFRNRVYLYRSDGIKDILREFLTGKVRPLEEDQGELPTPWN